MKKKVYWISTIIVIILIIAGVFAFNKHQQQENDVQSIKKAKSRVKISLHSSSMAREAAIMLKKI